jgi:hypothetical protein
MVVNFCNPSYSGGLEHKANLGKDISKTITKELRA